METKKTLRRHAEKARGLAKELSERLSRVEWALTGAESALDNLGYEPVDVQHPVFDRTERDWRLTEAQSAKIAARDAELAEHLAADRARAREEGRREALALVIEALEIPGYRPDAFRSILTGSALDHLERFRVDLTTAVEVRRDIAAATERGKVEKKVSELLKPRAAEHFVRQGDIAMSPADVAAAAARAAERASTVATAQAASSAAPHLHLSRNSVDHDLATAGEKLEDAA